MDLFTYNLLTFLLVILFILAFVTIVMWFKKKEGERNANVILTALEKGQPIDPELLRSGKSPKIRNKYILLALLVCGSGLCLFAALATPIVIVDSIKTNYFNEEGVLACIIIITIGVSLLFGYFMGKKMLASELEAEKNIQK